MQKKVKVNNKINRIIIGIYVVLLVWGFLDVIIGSRLMHVYTQKQFPADNLLYLAMALASMFFLLLLRKSIKTIINRRITELFNIFLVVILCLYFIAQIVIYHSLYFYAGWDAGVVWDTMMHLLNGEYEEINNIYFSVYSNNIFIVWLYTMLVKTVHFLMPFAMPEIIIMFFQATLNVALTFMLYNIAKHIYKSEGKAFFIIIVYMLFVGCSPWFIVTYSDQVGIFFPVTLIYISVLFEKEHIKTKKCILAFFYAFFCVIGIYIKPQVAIVVIAMGIVKLLQCLAKDVKNIYINIDIWGAMVLGAVLVVIAYNVIIVPSFRINIDKQLRFGISHYLMMGLNDSTDGVFSEDDVDFSISYLNKEDRILANIEESKSRLADYGVVGLFRHLNRKMLVNYGDGTFSWFVEGGFIADIPSWNYDEKALENYLWIIPEGTGYKKYISFAQTIWLILLILCIFAGMFGSDNEYYLLLKLIIIGITLFVLLFEARARYLFMFSPIYVLMSAKGFDNIYVIYRKHL